MIPIVKGTAPKALRPGEVQCQLSVLSSREGKFRVRCVLERHIPGNPAGVGFGSPSREEVEDLAGWLFRSRLEAERLGATEAYLDFPELDLKVLAIVKSLLPESNS